MRLPILDASEGGKCCWLSGLLIFLQSV